MQRRISVSFALALLTCGTLACNSTRMTPNANHTASGYKQTNLVADTLGTAAHVDRGLISPRAIAFAPGQPFFIADSTHGLVKVYDSLGQTQAPLGFAVPPPAGGNSLAVPAGIVFNPVAEDFVLHLAPSQFVIATTDGTISAWGLDSRGDIPEFASVALDHSSTGASYTGLAIPTPACCREFLAVANFHSGQIETYTVEFDLLAPPGSFTDPNLPAGYAPFGIQVVGNNVFVTYALQDAAGHDPVAGQGNGLVNVFDLEGNFLKRFASNGHLNAPWGVAQASPSFGVFSNDILIGNFGDGTINVFDPTTGNFLGTLEDASGSPIVNPGLWGLVLGKDGSGDPNTLYFTSGSSGHGLFGSISSN